MVAGNAASLGWRDDLTVHRRMLVAHPESARAHLAIARMLSARGERAEAAAHLQAALRWAASPADRLEGESDIFHARVRQAFLDLAAAAPHRYVVVDATLPAAHVDAAILDRVKELGLP